MDAKMTSGLTAPPHLSVLAVKFIKLKILLANGAVFADFIPN
jgi:hypothetical protein